MGAELNALQTIGRDVRGNLLVGDVFVLAENLKVERGKEILILIADDEQSPPQRAITVRANIEETIRSRGLGQLWKIGLHSGSDNASALNPCLAQIEILLA